MFFPVVLLYTYIFILRVQLEFYGLVLYNQNLMR